MNNLSTYLKGDRYIWLVVFLLSGFGLLAIYSSMSVYAQANNTSPEAILIKRFSFLLAGLVLMWLAHLIDFKYYSKIAQILLIITIPLLVYTLFFGKEINDARRWVQIPFVNISFQSSDLAKLALMMYIARFLSRKQKLIGDAKKSFLPILGFIVFICLLIAPANLSSAALLFINSLILLFIGRIPFKYLISIFVVGVLGFVMLFAILKNSPDVGRTGVWKQRMENYMNSSEDGMSFQQKQSTIAIARGKLKGVGAGNSIQKNYLPSAYADFIYSIILEEYGLIGGIFIMLIYLFFLYRCMLIVIKTPKAFGALLALGLSISLVMQAFVHMGVNVGILPVTGLTLPLISHGGTSLLFNSIAFGIILSVSRNEKEN